MEYCRLCVAQNFVENFIKFDSEIAKESRITEKMIKIGVDMSVLYLPKTICRDCLALLDQTFQFLERVQQSQLTLEKLLSDEFKNEEEIKEELLEELQESFASPMMLDYNTDTENNVATEIKIEKAIEKTATKTLKDYKKKLKKKSKIEQSTWNNYKWQCTKCDHTHTNLKSLRIHSIEIHKICCTLKCMDCPAKPFVNYKTFVKHVVKHRKDLSKVCFVCDTTSESMNGLRDHEELHNEKYICRVCAELFEDEKSLEHHINTYAKSIHYSQRLKPMVYQCQECSKVFKQSSQLYVHQVVHSENRPRNFACHLCAKTFFRRTELSVHLEIHENDRKYQCDICKRLYKRKAYLKHHVMKHLDKGVSCEYCGKNMTSSYIREHIKVFHKEEMKHCCSVCGKKFRLRNTLKVHERQHTGERPFCCEQCCHFFANYSNYYKHMKRRHSVDVAKRRLKLSEEQNFNLNQPVL